MAGSDCVSHQQRQQVINSRSSEVNQLMSSTSFCLHCVFGKSFSRSTVMHTVRCDFIFGVCNIIRMCLQSLREREPRQEHCDTANLRLNST